MNLFLCWIVAPAGLLLTCVGLSLLVERLTELSLPWAVRPALGMAIAIVLAQFGTATSSTAPLILPATLALAVLGLVLGYGVPGSWPRRAEVLVGGAVFGLFALPFLIHGDPTWAGYIKLDDSGTFMALSDHVFEHGRGVGHLPVSSHERTINANLSGSYPIGGFVPFALMSKLTGQDVAFLVQPSMAFAAAALGLLLFEAVKRLVRGAGAAVAIAVLASLSSLLLGYYLWGGVKEIVTAPLLALGPVLAGAAARDSWPKYAWIPISFAIGAMVAVLGPGGAAWIVPTLLPALVVLVADRGVAAAARQALPVVGLGALLVLPVLITPSGFFNPVQGGLTEATELGNLSGPLSLLHIAGVWPSLDFRSDPHLKPFTLALAVVCLAIAAITVVVCARLGNRTDGREGIPLAALAGGGAVGALLIIAIGSPWVDGKAMATISPMLLAATLLGITMLGQRTGFRLRALGVGLVVGGVIAWSAFLAYQGIWFAPAAHYRELAKVGDEFAGQGPALSTEVSIYGSRHFLRKLDDEGATDLRYRQIYLVGGVSSSSDEYVDLDRIQTDQLDPYNLIVVRRSPFESRPPASFELAYSGKYYEVWRSRPAPGELVEHLPLGNSLDPGATATCAQVGGLAAQAGPQGTLVAAHVDLPHTVSFEPARVPPSWTVPAPSSFTPDGSGTITAKLAVPAGTYEVWLGGAVFGGLELSIDGKPAGSERADVDSAGALEPLGQVTLAAGTHEFKADYLSGGLEPGSAAPSLGIGPLTVAPVQNGDLGLKTVSSADYRRLCGKRWDWIEAYR